VSNTKNLIKLTRAIKTRVLFPTIAKKIIAKKRQKNFKKIVKKIQSKAKQNKKIKVVFLVNQCAKFNWVKLYELLNKDKAYDPLIMNIAENKKEFENNNNYFKKINFKIKSGYDLKKEKEINLKKIKPDIVFFEEVYTHLYKKNSGYNVSKYALTCYGCYGIPLANHNKHHWNIIEFHSFLWKHFLFEKFSEENCKKTSFMKLKNTFLSGFPRFDELSSKTKKNKRKTIIWAPHQSILDEKKYIKILKSVIGIKSDLFSGTFDKNYKLFYELAKKYKNITWILKPHPGLKEKIITRGFMTEKEYKIYLQSWNKLKNTEYNNSRDYIELFERSDAIILDSIGFIAEYMIQNKPILFLNETINTKNKHYFNKLGKYLMKGCYKINNNKEIEKRINEIIINNKDHLKNVRKNIIKKIYIKNTNKNIKKLLDKTLKKA